LAVRLATWHDGWCLIKYKNLKKKQYENPDLGWASKVSKQGLDLFGGFAASSGQLRDPN
jgi:hypothetical protein